MSDGVNAVPAVLNSVVGSFIKRAREISPVQPLVAHFCYLYSAQLIIQSKKHMESEEAALYIGTLLDTIEQSKAAVEETGGALNDVLGDKEKSFKLVMSFSLSIFNKAVKDINNHVASKSTVAAFMAFLNFSQILGLWPDIAARPENDLSKQTKYAKFHSNRILKALKAGTDPNEYVTPEDEAEFSSLVMESNSIDPETVADSVAPEQKTSTDVSLSLPTAPSQLEDEMTLPTAPVLIKGNKNCLGLPTAPEFKQQEDQEEEESIRPPQIPSKPKMDPKPVPVPSKSNVDTNTVDKSKIMTKQEVEQIWKKSETIANAQKKAKFAISALNYEDIDTAIKELQAALDILRG